MTVAKSSIPYYVSIDCDHDISADTLLVTLDPTLDEDDWVTAIQEDPSDALIASAATCDPVPDGMDRYWWRFYSGSADGQVPLEIENNDVHGHLTDDPAELYRKWRVYAPAE